MWEALLGAQPFEIRDTGSVAAEFVRNAAMHRTLPTWLAWKGNTCSASF